MFALTTIIKSPSGSSNVHDGVLVKLPAELNHGSRIREYLLRDKAGWWTDSLGYEGYAKYDFEGNLIIVPALIIEDSGVKPKKFTGYNFSTTRLAVEKYVSGIIDFEKSALENATEDVNMLIHDLRRMSGAIYNAALEAENFIDQGNWREAKVRVENVQATQQLLKIRTDVLDFVGNPASIVDRREVDIYRKTDKVCRIFKPSGQKKQIDIYLQGESFKTSTGPEIFEIIPYVLLDNGVKYSPNGSPIFVEVWDKNDEISLSVESFGPRLLPHELLAVFEKGYRGKFAQAQGPGTGIGLFLMHQIVEDHFGGWAAAEQVAENPVTVNNMPFFRTKFEVRVPAS